MRYWNPAALVVTAAVCLPAAAQTRYAQSFDNVGAVASNQHGPANLIAQGWVFRNQSEALNYGDWQQGSPSSGYPAQEGANYIRVDALVAQANTRFSSWVILPVIPGLTTGDTVRLFVGGTGSSEPFNDSEHPRIQLRYSPSGGTGTGTNWANVGDFTVLLGQAGPRLYTWQEIEAQAPGTGRFALRWYKPTPFMMGGYPYAYVDNLTITGEPLGPPIPGPGETVHWTPAISPVVIDADTVIPPGATLIVDAGVTVHILDNKDFHIEGVLRLEGTPQAHVTFTGENNHAQMAINGGDIEAAFADFSVQLGADIGQFSDAEGGPGAAVFADCTFSGDSWYHLYASLHSMERCTYTSTYGMLLSGAVRMSDVTSTSTIQLRRGMYNLAGVTVQGAAGAGVIDQSGLHFEAGVQDSFLDGVSLLNNQGAGIYIAGGNALLGPNNTIQGNAVAVELGGGLLGGSVIPPAGNRDNGFISISQSLRVHPHDNFPYSYPGASVAHIRWEDVGIPYKVGRNQHVNPGGWSLTLAEGVEVQVGRDSVISTEEFGTVFVEGRPGNPVILSAQNPAEPWIGLAFATDGNRATDADISGSLHGFKSLLGYTNDLRNSYVHHNQYGGVLGVRARSTIFAANTAAGVSNVGSAPGSARPNAESFSNPNSFLGNFYGVSDVYGGAFATIPARGAWWGDPSGPMSADNPGGTGDRVLGDVNEVPFRTEAPDFTDHPPVVELADHDYIEPTARITLRWTASDDRGIVSQRLEWVLGSNASEAAFNIIADGLAPDVRAFEWTVPEVGFSQLGQSTYIRAVAIDTSGQKGYSEIVEYIPDRVRSGYFTITPDLTARTFRPGETIPVEFVWGLMEQDMGLSPDVWVELLNDDQSRYQSALYLPGPPLSRLYAPACSTDQARLVVIKRGTYNRAKFFFSETFAIRPDPRFGDAPPAITMTSPQAGQSFAAGTSIPVSWSASDDRGVRHVKLYASYDAGRTWQLAADNLPGPSGFHALALAAGQGFADVRIKAVAVDTQFQNTSAIASVSVTPGNGTPPCDPDLNADGNVDQDDVLCIINTVAGNPGCSSQDPDFNRDGNVDQEDVAAVITAVAGGGCP